MEFGLLCAIARAREDGILQGPLTQVTGQDKRSVPKRTDALHSKGYILKRKVFINGLNTSRLTLRRFADRETVVGTVPNAVSHPLKQLALQISTMLTENDFTTQDDLTSRLNMQEPARLLVFGQVVTQLVRRKCLKKIKAAFGPASSTQELKTCIQVIRQPTDLDWEKQEGDLVDFHAPLEQAIVEAERGLDPFVDRPSDALILAQDEEPEDPSTLSQGQSLQWNPDRLLPNVLFDLASHADTQGMTNIEVRQSISGLNVRRPVESILTRISHDSLTKQPSQARKLAIVRRPEVSDGVSRYIHRTFTAFKALVQEGQADWATVTRDKEVLNQLENEDNPDRDEFGFLIRAKPAAQIHYGAAGLEEIVRSVGAAILHVRPGEAILVEDESGKVDLSAAPDDGKGKHQKSVTPSRHKTRTPRGATATPSASTAAKAKRLAGSGRPRKFLKGTEKFWRDTFLAKRADEDPGFVNKEGKVGLTQDLNVLNWYKTRPPEFDATILKVLAAGLPLPGPDDVDQEWVGKMQNFMHRSSPGLYLTPTGLTKVLKGHRSLHMVFRSAKLGQIDFTERHKPAIVHFLSSSVAHTLRYYRTDSWVAEWKEKDVANITIKKATKKVKTQKEIEQLPTVSPPQTTTNDGNDHTGPLDSALQRGTLYEETPPRSHKRSGKKRQRTTSRKDASLVNDSYATAPDPMMQVGTPVRIESGHQHTIQPSSNPIELEQMIPEAGQAAESPSRVRYTRRSATTAVESRSSGSFSGLSPPRTGSSGVGFKSANVTSSDVAGDRMDLAEDRHPLLAVNPFFGSVLRSDEKDRDAAGRPQLLSVAASADISDHKGAAIVGAPEISDERLKSSPWVSPAVVESQWLDRSDEVSTGLTRLTGAPEVSSLPRPASCPVDATPVAPTIKPASVQESMQRRGSMTSLNGMVPISPHFEGTNAPNGYSTPQIESTDGHTEARAATTDDHEDNTEISNGHTNDVLLSVETGKNKESSSSTKPRFLTGKDAYLYYRQFILDLIYLCGGVVPDSPALMKRALKTKCLEANVESNIHIKILKSQLKSLVASNKVKFMEFAFQTRKGTNETKRILALPHVQPTDAKFIDMSTKMASLPIEEDYVPPALDIESWRRPSGRISRDPALEPKSSTPLTDEPREKRKRKRRSEVEVAPPSSPPARETASPQPIVTSNTGFLTLKVPGIASIKTSTTFTSHYFELPAPPSPIVFNADANVAASETAASLPASQRRSGVRIPRSSTYKPGQRKIEWRVPKTTPLPKSLQGILKQALGDVANPALANAKSASAAFEDSVELVANWEQRVWADLQERKPRQWNFINHLILSKSILFVRRAGELVFREVTFTGDHADSNLLQELETDLPEAESWDVFRTIVSQSRTKQKKTDAVSVKRKRKLDELDTINDDEFLSDSGASQANEGVASTPKRRKRTIRLTDKAKERKAGTDKDKRRQRKVPHATRGVGLRHLSKEFARRYCIAFVIVKVLAGGLDGHLDFRLVESMLPNETEVLLQERWKVLSTAFAADVDAYTQDFQIKYLAALADGIVPTVDYDDLDSTDWKSILDWACDNVNASSKDILLELPPSRHDFLLLNDVEVPEPRPIRNLYNQSTNFTMVNKEEAWCSAVTGTEPECLPELEGEHVRPSFPAEEVTSKLNTARARSWVLATVLTAQQNFDPATVEQNLLKLAPNEHELEELLHATTKRMQSDKILVKPKSGEAAIAPDGSAYPGTHGWQISSRWFDKFEANRTITTTMLKDAANFKLDILDPAFAKGEVVHLPKNAQMRDGDMVAVLNLMATGMLQILPGTDVPASRYGLDWRDQGYQTRSMDRDVLSFSTILEATPWYVQGDAMSSARAALPVPRGGMDQEDGLGLVPAWFDVNHNLQPHIWEMIIGCVVGIVSVRPGVSGIEIVRTLSWALSQYDMELVLWYLHDCEAIQKVGNGWDTSDWWWLITGPGDRTSAALTGTIELQAIA